MSRRRFRYVAAAGRLIEIIDLDEPPRAAAVMGDLPAYESPIDGRVIDGRAARREDLKRNQCRPYEAGELQAFEARRAAADRQLEARVGETVERFWQGKSGDERAQLARALESGADVRMMRK
jgi:hypothetical protein